MFYLLLILADFPILPSWLTGGASGGLMVLAYIAYDYFSKRAQRKADKEKQIHETEAEKEKQRALNKIEEAKIAALSNVDLSKLSTTALKEVADMSISMAQSANDRAKTAEEERDEERGLRRTIEDEFRSKLEEIEERAIKTEMMLKGERMIREQYRQQMRFLCDSMRIAYWTITSDGKFTGNQMFFDITGFQFNEDCDDGKWFEAVDEAEREDKRTRWNDFVNHHFSRPVFHITFRHLKDNEKVTRTRVFCEPMMLDGFTVYELTARTEPIQKQ
jgi:hypothetical protein